MQEQVTYFRDNLMKKQNQTLKINIWLSLFNKIESLDLENPETEKAISRAYSALYDYITDKPTDRKARRTYMMAYDDLVRHLKKTYGLIVKGAFLSISMAVGIGVGILTGLLTSTVETPQYALTVALGMILGVAVGNLIENHYDRQGKLI